MTYQILLGSGEDWSIMLQVIAHVRPSAHLGLEASVQTHARRIQEQVSDEPDVWAAERANLAGDIDRLQRAYQRSRVDIAALRHTPIISGGEPMSAAFPGTCASPDGTACLQILPFLTRSG
ncbi:hypothetical protein [Micromonospora sp. NPDC048830]|uniref:hypothetical protein n=1 Tax=Micromonospora sp. NPDC048830 TaxID=3364257 RepID=UPI003712F05C